MMPTDHSSLLALPQQRASTRRQVYRGSTERLARYGGVKPEIVLSASLSRSSFKPTPHATVSRYLQQRHEAGVAYLSSVLAHSSAVWRCGSHACLTCSVVRPRKRSWSEQPVTSCTMTASAARPALPLGFIAEILAPWRSDGQRHLQKKWPRLAFKCGRGQSKMGAMLRTEFAPPFPTQKAVDVPLRREP
jgi:hypothetical protein